MKNPSLTFRLFHNAFWGAADMGHVLKAFQCRASLVLLITAILGGALWGTARASTVPFYVQGTFDDGGTFSGTFQLDRTHATISVFSITSTGGSIFNGFSYESTNGGADRNVTPPSCGMIQFSFAVPNQSQIVIAVPGDSAATFNGGAITRTCPGASIISFEQLFPPTAVFRTVRSGLVSPLPSISVISTGCTSCSPGSVVTFHAHIVNPGPAIVVELKTGVRLPDGTIISLLGRHHEQALGAGQTVDIDLISGFVVPLGAPSGTYPVEAALLEPDLGVTLSRHSLPVQILP